MTSPIGSPFQTKCDRLVGGYLQYPTIDSPLICQPESTLSEVNSKLAKVDSCIGNLWPISVSNADSAKLRNYLELKHMRKQLEVKQHSLMSGKRKQESKEHNSSSEQSPSTIPTKKIGKKSGTTPREEMFWKFQQTSGSDATMPSAVFSTTTSNQSVSKKMLKSTGEKQAQAKRDEQRKKRDLTRIGKTLRLIGGAVTEINNLSSLTTSEEKSSLNTCLEFLIDTLYSLKSKAAPERYNAKTCGLPPTLTPERGTQTLEKIVKQLLCED